MHWLAIRSWVPNHNRQPGFHFISDLLVSNRSKTLGSHSYNRSFHGYSNNRLLEYHSFKPLPKGLKCKGDNHQTMSDPWVLTKRPENVLLALSLWSDCVEDRSYMRVWMMIWSLLSAYSFFPLASPALTYLTHKVQNEFTLATTSQNSFKNTAERKMEEISSLPLLE